MLGGKLLCLAVVVLSSFILAAEGVGPKCWHCSPATETLQCKHTGEQFIPEAVLNEKFCESVRNNTHLVKQLCVKYSERGYKVYCIQSNSNEIICERPECPSEQSRQFGGSVPSQSSSFIMVLFSSFIALTLKFI